MYVLSRLYKSYARPYLEFSTPVWSPMQAGDIEILESKKDLCHMFGLAGATYQDKLTELNFMPLPDRRVYFDKVEVYKLINGKSG